MGLREDGKQTDNQLMNTPPSFPFPGPTRWRQAAPETVTGIGGLFSDLITGSYGGQVGGEGGQ